MCSESENKYGDDVTSNHIINIKGYKTNIDKFLVCRLCAQGGGSTDKERRIRKKVLFII